MGEQVRLAPSEHWRAGMALLAKGEWELGWRLYESRPVHMGGRAEGRPKLNIPEWDGRPIRSLLILPEQGLGDQIMFARYAPWLASQGVAVTIMCHPLLERLFRSLSGVTVLPAQGRVELPKADSWALGPSLPYLCKTTLETVPPAPYLTADPRLSESRIGLMLAGNPLYIHDAQRSLSPGAAARLSGLPDAVSLAVQDTGARDLCDTAEIIAGLDVVIAVDTAVAHLAGALGVQCWVLLASPSEWRWLQSRADSPWYPSVRLFRQPNPGAWGSVVSDVLAALEVAD